MGVVTRAVDQPEPCPGVLTDEGLTVAGRDFGVREVGIPGAHDDQHRAAKLGNTGAAPLLIGGHAPQGRIRPGSRKDALIAPR